MEKTYFKYDGSGSEYAFIFFKNIFLLILTLGIYRPWARTNLRRYVWSHVRFQDDRGSYTGTGKELYRGWIKLIGALIVVFIVGAIASFAFSLFVPEVIFSKVRPILSACIYIYIFSLASYAGLRYRMSRTLWRQIRFGVERNKAMAREFSKLYIFQAFITGLTLGITYPIFRNKTHKYLIDRSRFGSLPFSYQGDSVEYMSLYWKNVFLSVITLGVYTPWFIKNTLKYRLNKTQIQSAHFDIDLPGAELLRYGIISYLAVIFTLGMATPWMLNWGNALFINHIHSVGVLNLESASQIPAEGSATADEFAADYDLDYGF